MTEIVSVVLAAGKSTRMKSELPKVLHKVCGRMMIEYVLDAARDAGIQRQIVVVGHQGDRVREALQHRADVQFAEQTEQKGTGHAVMMCEALLQRHTGSVLILAGDTPLLRGTSLSALLQARLSDQAACVIGTAETSQNEGLGRIVRDAAGTFQCIVEQKDATPEQRQITEINTGCYAFDCQLLLQALRQVRPNNVQSEYYLTDCPRILMEQGHPVTASCSLTLQEALGVNTRVQLAEVRQSIQRQIHQNLMLSGVSIEAPEQTIIDYGVKVGMDSTIKPFTVIEGDVTIGTGCTIGPHAWISGPAEIGDDQTIRSSDCC